MKLIKTINKFSEDYFEYITLLIGISLLCWGIYMFYIGFHNVDLGQNLRYLEAKHGFSLIDINSEGNKWTPLEMYMVGLDQIQYGLFRSILGTFLIGNAISLIVKKKSLYNQ